MPLFAPSEALLIKNRYVNRSARTMAVPVFSSRRCPSFRAGEAMAGKPVATRPWRPVSSSVRGACLRRHWHEPVPTGSATLQDSHREHYPRLPANRAVCREKAWSRVRRSKCVPVSASTEALVSPAARAARSSASSGDCRRCSRSVRGSRHRHSVRGRHCWREPFPPGQQCRSCR